MTFAMLAVTTAYSVGKERLMRQQVLRILLHKRVHTFNAQSIFNRILTKRPNWRKSFFDIWFERYEVILVHIILCNVFFIIYTLGCWLASLVCLIPMEGSQIWRAYVAKNMRFIKC